MVSQGAVQHARNRGGNVAESATLPRANATLSREPAALLEVVWLA